MRRMAVVNKSGNLLRWHQILALLFLIPVERFSTQLNRAEGGRGKSRGVERWRGGVKSEETERVRFNSIQLK